MSSEPQIEQAQSFAESYKRVRDQVGRVMVGQHEIVDGVLTALFAGGHCLLEGVPGLGKTLLIRTLSDALSLDFSRIQFTPDLMPSDITGTTIVVEGHDEHGRVVREFKFQKGPVFAQMVLADEINRATPKTQSSLLEAMQEKSVTIAGGAGGTHLMDKPFFVMATQNPIEQEGTYPLPEAQLDRFLFKLEVGYASRSDMHEILNRTTRAESPEVKKVMGPEEILEHQMLVRKVLVAPAVQDYAIRLALSTHPGGPYATPQVNQFVRIGASPRAAQALILGAKVRALLDGRIHVAVNDIREVATASLRHRILLNFEAQAEGLHSDTLIKEMIADLPAEVELPQEIK